MTSVHDTRELARQVLVDAVLAAVVLPPSALAVLGVDVGELAGRAVLLQLGREPVTYVEHGTRRLAVFVVSQRMLATVLAPWPELAARARKVVSPPEVRVAVIASGGASLAVRLPGSGTEALGVVA